VLHGSLRIRTLAVSEDGAVFAGTEDDGVFRAASDGDTWSAVNAGLTDRVHFPAVTSLAVSGSGHVFAGTPGGVFRSMDNGGSWTPARTGLPEEASIASLGVDAIGTVFAATGDQGIFRSTNSGDSWTPMDAGRPIRGVTSLAIGSNGNVFVGMYAGAGGVFRYASKGSTWTAVDTDLASASGSISSVAVNSRGHVFAGGQLGVLRSTTKRRALDMELPGSVEIFALAINRSDYLFAATSGGVFPSTNGGNWELASAGLEGSVWSFQATTARVGPRSTQV
jgi:photosystem II stability/assembly factor-like uncharacterized protein